MQSKFVKCIGSYMQWFCLYFIILGRTPDFLCFHCYNKSLWVSHFLSLDFQQCWLEIDNQAWLLRYGSIRILLPCKQPQSYSAADISELPTEMELLQTWRESEKWVIMCTEAPPPSLLAPYNTSQWFSAAATCYSQEPNGEQMPKSSYRGRCTVNQNRYSQL